MRRKVRSSAHLERPPQVASARRRIQPRLRRCRPHAAQQVVPKRYIEPPRERAGQFQRLVVAAPSQTVAVQRGSGSNFHMAWFLERNKIPADQVKVAFMAAPDQVAAFARNDVQAFFGWEPFVTRAKETVPNTKVWSRAVDDGLEFRGNVLMREDLARIDRDTAIKVVKGLIETAEWMNANPREAAKVANEVLRAPNEEDAYKQIQIFRWPGDFRKSVKEQEIKIAEWGAGIGLFPTKDPKGLVEQLIYPDIIRAAAPSRTDM